MDQLIQQKSESKMILYFIRKKLIISIFFCGTYQMRNNAPDFLRKNWDETGPNIFNFIQLYNRYCQKIHSFFHQSVEFFWIFVWHLLSYLPFFSFLFSFNTCKKIGWFDFCYAIFHIIITVPFSFFVLQLYESSSDNSDSSNFFSYNFSRFIMIIGSLFSCYFVTWYTFCQSYEFEAKWSNFFHYFQTKMNWCLCSWIMRINEIFIQLNNSPFENIVILFTQTDKMYFRMFSRHRDILIFIFL